MPKKDRDPNQNLSKLVSQVKVLSKTVDELEKEIKSLKLKICRNKDKKPTSSPKESKKVTNNDSSKVSPFRLNFFRKNDKTKENETPNESSKRIKSKKKDVSSDRQSSSGQNYADSNEVEGKFKRKSDFTQTSNLSTKIIRPNTQMQEQAKYSKSDTCCCNSRGNKINLKKSKIDKDKIKSKIKMCSNDCPYLPKRSYRDDDSRKPFKNKKLMVNLIGGNRDFKNQTRRNKNFLLDCKFLQNADFGKLLDAKDGERRRKIKLFGSDGCEPRTSKRGCKLCSKNCRTKNVLKIKKAILTQEPPMIFVSPDLEKSKVRRVKRKPPEDAEICEDDCCDCCHSLVCGSAEESNSFECPCSSFAASINARYNKLCQTEIPRK